jgi:hypothetical protein
MTGYQSKKAAAQDKLDDDDIQDYKRPWIDLTEDEMKKSWYGMENIMGWYSFQEVARAVLAKSKEKNT